MVRACTILFSVVNRDMELQPQKTSGTRARYVRYVSGVLLALSIFFTIVSQSFTFQILWGFVTHRGCLVVIGSSPRRIYEVSRRDDSNEMLRLSFEPDDLKRRNPGVFSVYSAPGVYLVTERRPKSTAAMVSFQHWVHLFGSFLLFILATWYCRNADKRVDLSKRVSRPS